MPLKFVVSGHHDNALSLGAPLQLPAGFREGRVTVSVQVETFRGAAGDVALEADPDKDVMAIHIANGPVLILNPQTAAELFSAQRNVSARAAQQNGVVRIPAQLEWEGHSQIQQLARGASRGLLGKVVVKLIQIISGMGKDTGKDKVVDRSARAVSLLVDKQVNPGLYRLAPKQLGSLKQSPVADDIKLDSRPLLVLLHGTFSSTEGSFGKLWTEHPGKVNRLFEAYSGVYALDHFTLTVSPIRNALELAQALPAGALIHLLSHSRGGLVGEVLAKVCSGADDLHKRFAQLAVGEPYKDQRDDLRRLIDLVEEKKLKVKRFVRVACPARGTLLASNRLDAFLSVFKWAMDLSGLPVLPQVLAFLAEVARRRSDPLLIPGLAAQMPDSPLVQWLHAIEQPVEGELRVIAGDMEGDSLRSWLKTLLSDTFFWTDNDLVVQTSSMYGGAPRAGSATFLLNRGGNVSHFSYFSNERTATAIVDGLTQEVPAQFRAIGPLSWEGRSSGGDRAARQAAPEKPAVFVLPGILGSNLKAGDRRIWLGPWLINGLDELAYASGRPDDVEPDGAVGMVYDKLIDYLGASHEVIEFAYDWRLPLEEEATRLAKAVEQALDARAQTRQPVRMLAHSMGGLLARTLQLERPQVWARMMADAQARLVMLGTPNGGSWAPMQVLSGDDSFGNGLAFAGAPFSPQKSRRLMASLPGFLQLQANLLDPGLNLSDRQRWVDLAHADRAWVQAHSFWHHLRIQQDYYDWGVPSAEVLRVAAELRRKLDAQNLSPWSGKMVMVVGEAKATPDGYSLTPEGEFNYLDVSTGDGRVTLQSALLPGVMTYRLASEHGDLPNHREAFAAYLALLQTGRTDALDELGSSSRRGAASQQPQVREASRPVFANQITPPVSALDVFSMPGQAFSSGQRKALPALAVTVINCNLKFTRVPLIVGHYASAGLTGSERVVDEMVGGLLGAALKIGLYPTAPRSNQVFMNIALNGDNPLQLPRPEAAIVVGLGQEGKLSSSDVVQTVRQGVLAWAQRLAEQRVESPATFEIAAALIGSGGANMSPGQSAVLIAQGVREANLRLDGKQWPTVTHLHLTELYLDRATEAWRALQALVLASPRDFVVTPTIHSGAGWLRRPLEGGYRSTRYDFISAVTQYDEDQLPMIAYTLDSKRARAEVRAQSTQVRLLHALIDAASNQVLRDGMLGKTLFKLLVPLELDAYLSGTTEMQIELDSSTAAIPWELLDTDRDAREALCESQEPWAIRCKLLRKLRTERYREQVVDALADRSVLIIGEPLADPERYPRLPGARNEARMIAGLFEGKLNPGQLMALIAEEGEGCQKVDALAVTRALLAQDWRIVHIAGHGEPPLFDPEPLPDTENDEQAPRRLKDPRGVVLSNRSFLGPREIKSMREVPELVFINCCYLGAIEAYKLLKVASRHFDRTRFAATVAEELIAIGVRCVVVAGWAVEDGPACIFASRFYNQLLTGSRFIDAVAVARREAWLSDPESNTWAAYQCYGDPDWVFRNDQEDANQPLPASEQGLDSIASYQALILALEIAVNDSRYQKTPKDQVIRVIETLEGRYGHRWIEIGQVCEAFAAAWAQAGEIERAIDWFERAIACNDASASLKASEQLGALKAQLAWQQLEAGGQSASALAAARKQTQQAIELLTRVCRVQPTPWRNGLCGAAYKHLAGIEWLANNAAGEVKALKQMQAYFTEAEDWALKHDPSHAYVPALERLAAQLFTSAPHSLDNDITQVQTLLKPWVENHPDFNNVAGMLLSRLYLAVHQQTLHVEAAHLLEAFAELKRRVPGVLNWREVLMRVSFVLDRYAATANPVESEALSLLRKGMAQWVREQ